MIQVTTKLSVKELAGRIGKSASFIYKARPAGLEDEFEWDEETRCFVSTEEQVRTWIKRNKFKIVRGRVQKG